MLLVNSCLWRIGYSCGTKALSPALCCGLTASRTNGKRNLTLTGPSYSSHSLNCRGKQDMPLDGRLQEVGRVTMEQNQARNPN